MNERDSDRYNEEERNGHTHTKSALMEMVNYSEATDSHHYWLLLVDFAIYLYNVNNHKCSLTYTIHNIKKYVENKHINSNAFFLIRVLLQQQLQLSRAEYM